MSGNIGSESAMRVIWESMGLEWPGKDSQEISYGDSRIKAPLFLGKLQKGGNQKGRSDSQSGGNDFQENFKD